MAVSANWGSLSAGVLIIRAHDLGGNSHMRSGFLVATHQDSSMVQYSAYKYIRSHVHPQYDPTIDNIDCSSWKHL